MANEETTTVVVKAKAKKSKRMDDAALQAKYAHYKAGSLAWDEVAQKQTAVAICEKTGREFTCFTSDLFQLRYHPEVRAQMRKEARAAKRAAAKAEAAPVEATA